MSKGVYALSKNGSLSLCTAPPEKRGQGRCNHIEHQNDNESVNEFIKRIEFVKTYETKQNSNHEIKNTSKTNDAFLQSHNQKAYKETVEMLNKYGKCAIVQPTGTGKSSVISAVVDDLKNEGITVVITPRNAINNQFEGHSLGVGGKGVKYYLYQSILTMYKNNYTNAGVNFDEVSLIVIDEMHRIEAKLWKVALESFIKKCTKANLKILGATATPDRLDKNNPVKTFMDGHSSSNLTIENALKDGILQIPKYVSIPNTIKDEFFELYDKVNNSKKLDSLSKGNIVKKLFKEYNDSDAGKNTMEKLVAENISDLIEKNQKLNKGVKILVFSKDNIESEKDEMNIQKILENKFGETCNISSCRYTDKHKKDKDYLKMFSDTGAPKGSIQILYTVDMFNEGVHIDSLDSVILNRKSESPTIYYQQIGRVLSISKNGDSNALVLDCQNNFNNVENCIDWNEIDKLSLEKFGTKSFYNYSSKALESLKDINLDIKESMGEYVGFVDGNRCELKEFLKEKNCYTKYTEGIIREKINDYGMSFEEAIKETIHIV